jgi:hypothetical protein
MKLALNQYMTNFGNLWSNKNIKQNLLNNLLYALLTVHLATQRVKERKEKIKQKVAEKESKPAVPFHDDPFRVPVEKITLIHKSRDSKYQLFRNARKEKQKWSEKADTDPENRNKWQQRADMWELCIQTFETVLANEVIIYPLY